MNAFIEKKWGLQVLADRLNTEEDFTASLQNQILFITEETGEYNIRISQTCEGFTYFHDGNEIACKTLEDAYSLLSELFHLDNVLYPCANAGLVTKLHLSDHYLLEVEGVFVSWKKGERFTVSVSGKDFHERTYAQTRDWLLSLRSNIKQVA